MKSSFSFLAALTAAVCAAPQAAAADEIPFTGPCATAFYQCRLQATLGICLVQADTQLKTAEPRRISPESVDKVELQPVSRRCLKKPKKTADECLLELLECMS